MAAESRKTRVVKKTGGGTVRMQPGTMHLLEHSSDETADQRRTREQDAAVREIAELRARLERLQAAVDGPND